MHEIDPYMWYVVNGISYWETLARVRCRFPDWADNPTAKILTSDATNEGQLWAGADLLFIAL